MNLRRTARWIAVLTGVLVGVLLVCVTFGFVPDYISDKTPVDKATYLGTIVGSISLLVVIIQLIASARRGGGPDSTAAQLRAKAGTELDRRLGDMRRTAEDITLTYRLSADGQEISLDDLIDVLSNQAGRVILTGPPGVGKTYTTLQVAAALIRRDSSTIPLVVPLSRWTEIIAITDGLSRFLETEFNVPAPAAKELVETGKILPIFDGLDELHTEEVPVEAAAEFLARLIDWRIIGSRPPFLVACRRSAWHQISPDLTSHHTLTAFSIMAVGRSESYQYLVRSISRASQTSVVDELVRSIQQKGHGYLLTRPWQLSLIAEIINDLANRSKSISAAEIGEVADLASVDNLIAYYVESARSKSTRWFTKIQRTFDYWWLSSYAKYLVGNQLKYVEANHLGTQADADPNLLTRDLVLHRLWPVAGDRAPRLVDLMMCIVLSAPGFYWAQIFLWHRGIPARILLTIFGLIWVSLLGRTSTKRWVRPAMPNWSRLTDPKFFLPQLGAAMVIGSAAWFIVNPISGAVCFISAWLAIGLTVGFGQTLATDAQPKVVGPLGILRRERQVSRFSAAVVFPVLAAGFSVTWGIRFGIWAALAYCLVVGETVACALWRRYLAMIISSLFRLPPDPAHCLQRMHTLGHLRIAGISYQFRHDDVLRYFAQRNGLRGGLGRNAIGTPQNRAS